MSDDYPATKNMNQSGRQFRRRIRGTFSGKKSKAVGITSLAAPVIGYVVNDLRKPDSTIRSLIGVAYNKLLSRKTVEHEAIDITDQVEIIEDNSEAPKKADNNK